MRILKPLLIVALLVGGLAVAGWYGLRQLPASFCFGIRAEFEATPADDKQLKEWLNAQPGVFKASVHREDGGVIAIWMMERTLGGAPPVPDIRAAFERFGYREMSNFDPDG